MSRPSTPFLWLLCRKPWMLATSAGMTAMLSPMLLAMLSPFLSPTAPPPGQQPQEERRADHRGQDPDRRLDPRHGAGERIHRQDEGRPEHHRDRQQAGEVRPGQHAG